MKIFSTFIIIIIIFLYKGPLSLNSHLKKKDQLLYISFIIWSRVFCSPPLYSRVVRDFRMNIRLGIQPTPYKEGGGGVE